jgi:hypothetical protein
MYACPYPRRDTYTCEVLKTEILCPHAKHMLLLAVLTKQTHATTKKKKLVASYYIFIQITFPNGNFFRNASVLLVSPNTNPGSTFTLPPEYCAAIRALYARKFSG